MGLGVKTKENIQLGVDAQLEFKNGNVKGVKWGRRYTPPLGRLDEPYKKQIQLQCEASLVKYLIYSYETPIAWILESGTWIVPIEKYSSTTTHHQSVVRTAIDNYDFWNKLAR